MFTSLMPNPKQQFFNSQGLPLVNGSVYTYAAGTSTPKDTYTDEAGTIPQPNPVPLNARGEPTQAIRWSGAYKVEVKDVLGNLVYSVDNFESPLTADEISAPTGAGLMGFVYATAYGIGSIGRWLKDLALQTGATFIGCIQYGIGGVPRTLQDKLNDNRCVEDFGAKGDGSVDDQPAIITALNAMVADGVPGTLRFTKPIYLVNSPLQLTAAMAGMTIKGECAQGSYFITPNGSTFDIIKVAGADITIEGFLFRPGGDQVCIHTYAPQTNIQGNRFLADVNNIGTAILTGDVDPDTLAFVPGAYTHTIENNTIGVAGYAFARAIDASSTAGMQAMKIRNNRILSAAPINIPRGGGNVICENLLQSSSVGVGIGIDLGANEAGDMIYGNYIEGFADAILTRQASNANPVVRAVGNHYDGNTRKFNSFGGTINYVYENDTGTMWTNSWLYNYSSGLIARWLTPSAAEGFALTSGGFFLVNTVTGTNHTFNSTGVVEGAVIFTLQGAGTSSSFFRYTSGTSANGARTAFSCKADSTTLRGISSGGTLNASGADYAEYMKKSRCCFDVIAKGQIVFLTAAGEVTDNEANAIPNMAMVKSTDPSIVGGDKWATHLGDRPEEPSPVHQPAALELPELRDGATDEEITKHTKHVNEIRAEHQAQEAAYSAYVVDKAAFDAAAAKYDAALEVARAGVDRIAFCGQVPVNVYNAKPGDFILPDNGGTAWDMFNDPEVPEWAKKLHRSVGRVITIEEDGRARIIVH